MKLIKSLVGALFVAAAFTVTAATPALEAPKLESTAPWTLTLGGGGSTAVSDKATAFSTELSLGHTAQVLVPLELGVRQSVSYSSLGDSSVKLGTRGYVDVKVLTVGNVSLLAGVNGGANYGQNTVNWVGGPEVEARLALTKDVFAFGRAEYEFALNNRTALNQTDKDNLLFKIGLGCRF